MPSVSKKQHNFMEAIAHGMKPKGGKGPSKSVAQEFASADAGRKFRSGGHVKRKRKSHISPAMLAALAAPPPGPAGPPPGPPMGGPPPGMGGPPGMKAGGRVESRGDGKAQKGRTGTEMVKMAKGGAVRGHGAETKGRTRGRFV